jgi:V8-like Glu-specific endopeptidase
MKRFITFFTLLLSLTLVFAFAGNGNLEKNLVIRQAQMEKAPGTFDAAAYFKKQQETFDWLKAEAAHLSPEAIISIVVSNEDLAELESGECETCGDGLNSAIRKFRIGLTKPVGVKVDLSGLNLESFSGVSSFAGNGMVQATPDGGFVWTAAAESSQASGLRVHFNNLDLPNGAELYVYNANGQAFGPYTNRGPNNNGDFWSNTVSGSLAYIQLRFHGQPSASDLQALNFSIDDIGHLTPKFVLPFLQKSPGTPDGFSGTNAFCSYNEPCVVDASCHNVGAVADSKKAVAYMQWISGAWIYSCSGGLVADTDSSSQIPYFITANHCISRNKAAGALECYWQYQTSNCGGACYDPVGAVPRTLGSSVVSTNRTADYTLLQLSEAPPSGSVFLGWTTANVANANGAKLYRISHPSGAPQAYSQHDVDTSAGTCSSWPRGPWIYSRDQVGATEGGSSGSPVVNGSGQLVGQLSGGCGTNVNEVCDFENNATVDGAFAYYYSEVAQYLDNGGGPGGSEMHVDSIVLSTKTKGPKTDAIAKVTILDENGDPVAGADVTGTFTGDATGTVTATTNSSGEATLKITVQGSVNNFGFCVDNVTHGSLSYNSSANVVTCK